MRRVLVPLLVLAVLLLAADVAARAYTESKAASALQRSFELSERPDVSLGGFPFLIRLASGRFPTVTLEAEGFEAGDVPIQSIDVRLRDVAVPVGELASGEGTIRAASGEGSAVITSAGATAGLRAQGAAVELRFEGGRAFLRADGIPGELAARVSLDEGRLVLTPADGAVGSFALPVPPVVPGVRYTAVRLSEGVAVVAFRFRATTFEF